MFTSLYSFSIQCWRDIDVITIAMTSLVTSCSRHNTWSLHNEIFENFCWSKIVQQSVIEIIMLALIKNLCSFCDDVTAKDDIISLWCHSDVIIYNPPKSGHVPMALRKGLARLRAQQSCLFVLYVTSPQHDLEPPWVKNSNRFG